MIFTCEVPSKLVRASKCFMYPGSRWSKPQTSFQNSAERLPAGVVMAFFPTAIMTDQALITYVQLNLLQGIHCSYSRCLPRCFFAHRALKNYCPVCHCTLLLVWTWPMPEKLKCVLRRKLYPSCLHRSGRGEEKGIKEPFAYFLQEKTVEVPNRCPRDWRATGDQLGKP